MNLTSGFWRKSSFVFIFAQCTFDVVMKFALNYNFRRIRKAAAKKSNKNLLDGSIIIINILAKIYNINIFATKRKEIANGNKKFKTIQFKCAKRNKVSILLFTEWRERTRKNGNQNSTYKSNVRKIIPIVLMRRQSERFVSVCVR